MFEDAPGGFNWCYFSHLDFEFDFEEDRCSWAEIDKGVCSLPVVRWCAV